MQPEVWIYWKRCISHVFHISHHIISILILHLFHMLTYFENWAILRVRDITSQWCNCEMFDFKVMLICVIHVSGQGQREGTAPKQICKPHAGVTMYWTTFQVVNTELSLSALKWFELTELGSDLNELYQRWEISRFQTKLTAILSMLNIVSCLIKWPKACILIRKED